MAVPNFVSRHAGGRPFGRGAAVWGAASLGWLSFLNISAENGRPKDSPKRERKRNVGEIQTRATSGQKQKARTGKKKLALSGPVPKIVGQLTGKLLIPIKYRNCNFFSVS